MRMPILGLVNDRLTLDEVFTIKPDTPSFEIKFWFIDNLASQSLLFSIALFSQESQSMKFPHSQSSAPCHANHFDAIDSLIISLIIFFIIVGVCLLAPVYFTTHLVLGLIKPAASKPASASSNQAETMT